MLDAFNGKRFNFGRSIARAKDGFVKKFLESLFASPRRVGICSSDKSHTDKEAHRTD